MIKQSKLNLWVQKNLLTQNQADEILSFERSHHNGFLTRALFVVAGLFIGLGLCLIVAANWDALSSSAKFTLDFGLFFAFIFGAFDSLTKNKKHLADLFLFLCFLMVAATIGLTGQVFHLSGGWQRFALFWAILSLPYALMSRSFSLNMVWLLVLFSALDTVWFEKIWRIFANRLDMMCVLVVLLCLLGYGAKRLSVKLKKRFALANAFHRLMIFEAYLTLVFIVFKWGVASSFMSSLNFGAVAFIVLFLASRMWIAYKGQHLSSFKTNMFLLEAYVFLFFAARFDRLLESGVGLVLCGLLMLGAFYAFKKFARYIYKLEIFK